MGNKREIAELKARNAELEANLERAVGVLLRQGRLMVPGRTYTDAQIEAIRRESFDSGVEWVHPIARDVYTATGEVHAQIEAIHRLAKANNGPDTGRTMGEVKSALIAALDNLNTVIRRAADDGAEINESALSRFIEYARELHKAAGEYAVRPTANNQKRLAEFIRPYYDGDFGRYSFLVKQQSGKNHSDPERNRFADLVIDRIPPIGTMTYPEAIADLRGRYRELVEKYADATGSPDDPTGGVRKAVSDRRKMLKSSVTTKKV